MVVYNLGHEQGSRQLRGGRGQAHWRGGIQARGGPDAKENEDRGRDRQENCESGA